jgi:hypothetical protein
MAPFAIIPYDPARAHANRRSCKPSILPADASQSQAMAVADSLTIREKDSDSSSDGDQGNHDSVHASQSQNHVCAQNPKDDDAPIFVGGSEEVSDDGECDVVFIRPE